MQLFTCVGGVVCGSYMVCFAPLQRYRDTLCTFWLHCAPLSCDVHNGAQRRPIFVHQLVALCTTKLRCGAQCIFVPTRWCIRWPGCIHSSGAQYSPVCVYICRLVDPVAGIEAFYQDCHDDILVNFIWCVAVHQAGHFWTYRKRTGPFPVVFFLEFPPTENPISGNDSS